ncbi:MAG TPA: DUF6166 domain-containing protein [Verrucomicrobiae bacterium]|nr:DUF6166 domain-containing protein [Verrucomicrobiae bacterium]
MRRYEGKREGYATDVTVNGRPLNPRLDLWNHSPTGFGWGTVAAAPRNWLWHCCGSNESVHSTDATSIVRTRTFAFCAA